MLLLYKCRFPIQLKLFVSKRLINFLVNKCYEKNDKDDNLIINLCLFTVNNSKCELIDEKIL